MTTLGQPEKCLRNHAEKDSFPGVGCPPDAKLAPPGATGRAMDQTRLKRC